MSDDLRPCEFDKGFKRGDQFVTKVQLRRPMGGALRKGVSVVDLIRQDYDAVRMVAPRITMPPMTVQDVDDLEPPDVLKLGTEIASFFLTATDRAEAGLET